MRFEWESDIEIGHYKCTLFDDNDKKIDKINFTDYTNPYNLEDDAKHRFIRPYSFEVNYCHGFSMHQGFDDDEEYDRHSDEKGRIKGGYQGICTHTVNDIKKWCEEFLASLYIIDYEEELKELQNKKKTSDWFTKNGYTGNYEECYKCMR